MTLAKTELFLFIKASMMRESQLAIAFNQLGGCSAFWVSVDCWSLIVDRK